MARAPSKTAKPKDETASDERKPASEVKTDEKAPKEPTPVPEPKEEAPTLDEEASSGKQEPGRWVWVSCQSPRRRAGLSFGPEPIKVNFAALSEDQLEALKSDTKLVVRPVEE